MEIITMNKDTATVIERSLIDIGQSLDGVSRLLEEISNKTEDQVHETCCVRAILHMITKKVDETSDAFWKASQQQ